MDRKSLSSDLFEDAREIFRKKQTCSRTFYFLLNRAFDELREKQELAASPLAGGILQKGHQCGMLWGATLASGAACYRKFPETNQATQVAIKTTQQLIQSFKKQKQTTSCREITRCDFSNKWSMFKYMISGRFLACFKLAETWAPEAIQTAANSLNDSKSKTSSQCVSCVSEVARIMGASEEEGITVAGFAGGLGLSGEGCGALAAAIWLNTMAWLEFNPDSKDMINPFAEETFKVFAKATGDKIQCKNIIGRYFKDIEDHSNYIENGGCKELINTLAATKHQTKTARTTA